MRSFLALLVGAVAVGGVAQAQTVSAPDRTGSVLVEGVAQSAFGNVTSQSFGGAIGVTILPNAEVFFEGGRVNDVATAPIGAAAQTIGGYLSQTQANVTYNVKEPVTFGVLGAKYVVPMTGRVLPYVLGGRRRQGVTERFLHGGGH
jgi:opacity protein-like surface antigen